MDAKVDSRVSTCRVPEDLEEVVAEVIQTEVLGVVEVDIVGVKVLSMVMIWEVKEDVALEQVLLIWEKMEWWLITITKKDILQEVKRDKVLQQ
jgi:hypothetical protein